MFFKGHNVRDMMTVLLMKWILVVCTHQKIGVFLSDTSWVLDPVFTSIILVKLQIAGIREQFLKVLDAYLGEMSENFDLFDDCFRIHFLGLSTVKYFLCGYDCSIDHNSR